jgi:hypothetical protein
MKELSFQAIADFECLKSFFCQFDNPIVVERIFLPDSNRLIHGLLIFIVKIGSNIMSEKGNGVNDRFLPINRQLNRFD